MLEEKYEEFLKILAILQKDADLADIFWEETEGTNIICENKRLEKVICGQDKGIGLRILKNGKTSYGFTNDLSFKGLVELAQYLSQEKEGITVGDIKRNVAAWPQVKYSPLTVPLSQKVDFVQRADRVAWSKSPFIKQVKVIYREKIRRFKVLSSLNGLSEETQIRVVFLVQVVGEKNGILQTGYEPWGASKGLEIFEEKSPEEIAEIATDRALKMLKAAPAPSGTMPVVLSSEAGGTMIHEAIGHGLEADLAHEGLSVYANKIEEQVASPLITVVDDPTLKGHYGHYIYDDEGTPAQRVVLIENGILKTYLYNNEYALKAGVFSNGHGRRQSYRHKPIPRMGNTFIAPGKDSPEEIIKSVEKGLLVRKMGGGQVNTINGDFVFEATEAYLLEKGQIGEPVRGATLVGNGPKILQSIAMVGNDLQFGFGTCGKDAQHAPVSDGQPTLLIPEIIVGGTSIQS